MPRPHEGDHDAIVLGPQDGLLQEHVHNFRFRFFNRQARNFHRADEWQRDRTIAADREGIADRRRQVGRIGQVHGGRNFRVADDPFHVDAERIAGGELEHFHRRLAEFGEIGLLEIFPRSAEEFVRHHMDRHAVGERIGDGGAPTERERGEYTQQGEDSARRAGGVVRVVTAERHGHLLTHEPSLRSTRGSSISLGFKDGLGRCRFARRHERKLCVGRLLLRRTLGGKFQWEDHR